MTLPRIIIHYPISNIHKLTIFATEIKDIQRFNEDI